MEVIEINPAVKIPWGELTFKFVRSGGPGGQNVNKVSSKVELSFDVKNSVSLTEEQRKMLLARLRTRIDKQGVLRISSQESRSQWKNRQAVLDKFVELLRLGLKPERQRIPTKPKVSSSAKRVESKKSHAAKKRLRQRVRPGDE